MQDGRCRTRTCDFLRVKLIRSLSGRYPTEPSRMNERFDITR
jgi:hypothetical protein